MNGVGVLLLYTEASEVPGGLVRYNYLDNMQLNHSPQLTVTMDLYRKFTPMQLSVSLERRLSCTIPGSRAARQNPGTRM